LTDLLKLIVDKDNYSQILQCLAQRFQKDFDKQALKTIIEIEVELGQQLEESPDQYA